MEKPWETALKLARKGKGKVAPNPLVGAVIEKKGRIIAVGWHKKFGDNHAEANALENATLEGTKDAEMFVSLEPCNHYGKQGPCTRKILKARIKRVHVAMLDPNEGSKNGALELMRKGVKLSIGLGEEKAKKQNNFYIIRFGFGRKPNITLKIAMSFNGAITFGNGKRKKISGRTAFEFTQKLRKKNDAILVGVNTIIKDNPKLTVRKGFKNPVRIVLDSKGRVPLDSKIFSEKGISIVVVKRKTPWKRVEKLMKKTNVIIAKESKGKIDLDWLMNELYLLGIRSVLVEAGQKVASSFLNEKIFDKLLLIVADKKIDKGLKAFKLKKKLKVRLVKQKKLGPSGDLLLEMEKSK